MELNEFLALPKCSGDKAGNNGESTLAPQQPKIKSASEAKFLSETQPTPEVKGTPHAKASPRINGQISGQQAAQLKDVQSAVLGQQRCAQLQQKEVLRGPSFPLLSR